MSDEMRCPLCSAPVNEDCDHSWGYDESRGEAELATLRARLSTVEADLASHHEAHRMAMEDAKGRQGWLQDRLNTALADLARVGEERDELLALVEAIQKVPVYGSWAQTAIAIARARQSPPSTVGQPGDGAAGEWAKCSESMPPPHARYEFRFVGTPCYGMHKPWVVMWPEQPVQHILEEEVRLLEWRPISSAADGAPE